MALGKFKPYRSNYTDNDYPIKCFHAKYKDGFYYPCGKCDFCMKARAREWAFRLESEGFDKHVYNCLLTYEDSSLPMYKGKPSLNRTHIQDFLKRFRYYIQKHYNVKIRFFLCGEYGGLKGRPHYHMILFSPKPFEQSNVSDSFSFIQDILQVSWRHGWTDIEKIKDIGGSCGYLVTYLTSYSDGKEYDKFNKPFLQMSRDGIGRNWIDNHPKLVNKMVNNMDYTISNILIPRYLRRKIMPEEQQIALSDMYRDYSMMIHEELSSLPTSKKYCYENLRKQDQREQKLRQLENYRKRKIHVNNSNTSQLSRRVDATKVQQIVKGTPF